MGVCALLRVTALLAHCTKSGARPGWALARSLQRKCSVNSLTIRINIWLFKIMNHLMAGKKWRMTIHFLQLFVAYRHFSKSLQGILKYYSIRPHMHTHGRVVRFSTQQYLHFILIFSQKVIARKSLRVFFLNSIVLKRRKKFKHFATILFDHLPFWFWIFPTTYQ